MKITTFGKSQDISSYKEHSHPKEWEIAILLTGTAKITIGEVCYNVRENDIIVIPPGITHKGISDVFFGDVYFRSEFMDFPEVMVVQDYDGNVRVLFEVLKKVMSEREINYAAISDSLTETICEYIKKYSKTHFKYDFVVAMKNKIYENLSNHDFNIADEVHLLGFNTDYFRRCFKEELDQTPLEYMTNLRISLAKRLLVQRTFQSIEKVAFQCGFRDSFYFSKMFKKYTGISPKDYRKRQLANR